MKRIVFLITGAIILLFASSCERESGQGVLKLSLTDAPVDTSGLSGVYITINEIQAHNTADGWIVLDEFEGPKTINLLDLTRGVTDSLGDFVLEGGYYTQIRFILDAAEKGKAPHSNPGCYMLFEDETAIPLFVPSGSQSGFKATGEFMVPVNDTIRLTADFDVRKSVVKAGNSGMFILKPVIRLVADGEAGSIRGIITNIPDTVQIVVYAYADGTYTEEEDNDPAEGGTRFPKAVSSDIADEEGVYHIAFLAEGTYDLIITTVTDGVFGDVLGTVEDVVVESRKTNTQDIDISIIN